MKCAVLLEILGLLSLVQSSRVIRQVTGCRNCVLLAQCPSMMRLLQSGHPENLRVLRSAICGFQGLQSLICCPDPSNRPTVPVMPTVAPHSGSLLPDNCGHSRDIGDRIFGGTVAHLGAYPWMAAFGYTESGVNGLQWLCSGSVINERYVLTAAHCINSPPRVLSVIRLGEWDLRTDEDCEEGLTGRICSPPARDYGVEEAILHPQYNQRHRFSDDIAIIRLNASVNFRRTRNYVYPVCLPSQSIDLRSFVQDKDAIGAGWGLTERQRLSDILLHVKLPFADESLCRSIYGNLFSDKQLCVGGKQGQDTCSGDSGGPLIMTQSKSAPPYVQIGIVSIGQNPCGRVNVPAVYTSLWHYRRWIEENLKP